MTAQHAGVPIATQYLAMVMPQIPLRIRSQPGSRAFRAELKRIALTTGLMPTRSETLRAHRQIMTAHDHLQKEPK